MLPISEIHIAENICHEMKTSLVDPLVFFTPESMYNVTFID